MTAPQTAAGQSPITWGPEIPVSGRPGWLTHDIPVFFQDKDGECGNGGRFFPPNVDWPSCQWIRLPASHWANTVFAYNAAHPDEQPFVPWSGGAGAPVEGDVEVMLRDGPLSGNDVSRYRWGHVGSGTDIIAYRPRLAKPEAAGEELLPCPFCGRKPCLDGERGVWTVMCVSTECGEHITKHRMSREGAVSDWNRRAPPPSTSVTIERMSEQEALALWNPPFVHLGGGERFVKLLRHLDLIADPETPLDRYAREKGLSEADKELVRQAIEAGVGK
ncbi:Lar family restriction alleviation protein [Sphingomonas sanxanigenens]|uniref:Restriction alleviation protein Lar n=1 Tax=Sphingomonas sanxanigenens DSM 19645 = NX02 TaxID=1123269 RepID=W0A8K8_9SPHN|nr:Lar family restriction alleviation protein [Sphingomonas sanxanigenens]AHE52663.1 hypothetical protein NX02_04600 [Sphingomonas sanxanigenens DSM 19645 = NX02]